MRGGRMQAGVARLPRAAKDVRRERLPASRPRLSMALSLAGCGVFAAFLAFSGLGVRPLISPAEARYALEPASDSNPETIFEQRWALTVLENGLSKLKTEYAAAGKPSNLSY